MLMDWKDMYKLNVFMSRQGIASFPLAEQEQVTIVDPGVLDFAFAGGHKLVPNQGLAGHCE